MRSAVRFLLILGALALAAPAAYAQFTVEADTASLWHFDEGSGAVAADSGPLAFALAFNRYPSDGSQGNDFPTWQPAGCFGAAIDFAKGSSDLYGGFLLASGMHEFPNDVTVELWLRTTSTSAILFHAGQVQLYLALESNGTVRATFGDKTNWGPGVFSDAPVNDGAWHYVAATYDGSNVRLFVDGVENDSASYSGTLGTLSSFHVGGRGQNSFFEGTIDEVRVSESAHDGAAIEAAWNELSLLCPEPDGGTLAAGGGLALLGVRRRRATASASTLAA